MTKILHTADIHLDSPLKSLALRDPDLQAQVQVATRGAFSRLINLALSERVDGLLICGDLFDGAERSAKTVAFLVSELDRLRAAQIQVFYIKGNHDAENPLTKSLNLPDNVHTFDAMGGCAQLGETNVWIHGVSFSGKHAPDSLLPKFGAPVPGAVNIAMLHTSLAGSAGHDDYAPCALRELTDLGFDYWALGHIHQRKVYSEAPWVVMPGIPQGRDVGEAGPKSATLIEINGQELAVSEVQTSLAEFLNVSVDLQSQETQDEQRDTLRQTLEKVAADLTSEVGIVRLTLHLSQAQKWSFLRDEEKWVALIEEMAQQSQRLWLEKLKFKSVETAIASVGDETAISKLEALMDEISKEPGFATQARALFDPLIGDVTPASRRTLFADEAAHDAQLRQLANTGADAILAAMKGATD